MPDDRTRTLLEQYDVILRDICVEYALPNEQIRSIKEYVVRFFKTDRRKHTFFALKHINLQIGKGEIFGIIGRNGAGKSTLMKVISRVLIPTTGRLITHGQISPLLQLGAGFHPELTGLENIFLNGTLLGHTRFQIREKMESIIAFSEIGDFIHAPVRNYSSGMRARLGFAVATAWQPEILVLDEVLSVGDIAFRKKCQQRMQLFREEGTTTILVSHIPKIISKICTRAAWMDKGEILLQGQADYVAQSYVQSQGI